MSRMIFTAYYWPEDRMVSVDEAIKMREESGDIRAGDFWCHKDCYQQGKGLRLYPRSYRVKSES